MNAEETKNESEKKSGVGEIISWIAAVACLLLIGGVIGYYCSKIQPKQSARPPAAAVPVVTALATNGTFNPVVQYVGHVEPTLSVDVIPQIEGYVKEVHFKEGSSVKAGDLLYVIDDERYDATVALREAELASAEAEKDRADRYLKRLQSVDARAITQSDLDSAISGAATAKAAVLQAKANIALSKYDEKHTKIFASISGYIGKSFVYPGDFVSPSKGVIARIVQSDPIRVTFPLTDREYIDWRQLVDGGDSLATHRIRLMLPNGTEYTEKGTWDFNDNEMSASTATIQVRISFPNPTALLVPNTFVTILADYAQPPMRQLVPEHALGDFPGGGVGVWVIGPDNRVKQTKIETFGVFGGQVAVKSGLAPDARVVVEGTQRMNDGVEVSFEGSAAAGSAKASQPSAPAAK